MPSEISYASDPSLGSEAAEVLPAGEQPVSRSRVRAPRAVPAPASSPAPGPGAARPRTAATAAEQSSTPRRHPDEEAMLLMMKVVERVEVARSFARIAAGIVSVSAVRAAGQLREVADAKMADAVEGEGGLMSQYARVRKIARAAAEAAVHVATHRPEPESDEKPEPALDADAAPETTPAPANR